MDFKKQVTFPPSEYSPYNSDYSQGSCMDQRTGSMTSRFSSTKSSVGSYSSARWRMSGNNIGRHLRKSFNRKSAKWHWEVITRPENSMISFVQRFVDSTFYQVFVTLTIALDFTLTIYSLSSGKGDVGLTATMQGVTALIILDLTLRLVVDGRFFFHSILNVFEFVTVILCVASSVLEVNAPTSLGRTVRPLFRIVKVFHLASKVVLGRHRVGQRFDKLVETFAISLKERLIGDFLQVPPKNIKLGFSNGYKFRLEKAQIISSALADLHLPFTIKGGFVELISMEIKTKENAGKGKVTLIIWNLCLVLGPANPPPWTLDEVRVRKGHLIEFISRRTEAFSSKGHDARPGAADHKKAKKTQAQRLKEQVINAFFANLHVDIRNIVVRYEDSNGALGAGSILGGFKLGHLSLGLLSQPVTEDPVRGSDAENETTSVKAGTAETSTADATSGTLGTAEPSTVRKPFQCVNFFRRKSTADVDKMNHAVHRARGVWHDSGQEVSCNATGHDDVPVGGNLTLNRVSVWLDIDPQAQLYTDWVTHDVQIQDAIFHHKKDEVRERLAVAAMSELENRSWSKVNGEWKRKERPRLGQVLAAHKFILHPTSISVHAMVRKPRFLGEAKTSPMSGDSDWPVMTDIDIEAKHTVHLDIDVAQADCIAGLSKYVKLWRQEDKLFRWHPMRTPLGVRCCVCPISGTNKPSLLHSGDLRHHPHHLAETKKMLIRRWWRFALAGVMWKLDRNERWKVLELLDHHSIGGAAKQYKTLAVARYRFAKQISVQHDEQGEEQEQKKNWKPPWKKVKQEPTWNHHDEVEFEDAQVSLPLQSVLEVRKQARQIVNAELQNIEALQSQDHRMTLSRVWTHAMQDKPDNVEMGELVDLEEEDDASDNLDVAINVESKSSPEVTPEPPSSPESIQSKPNEPDADHCHSVQMNLSIKRLSMKVYDSISKAESILSEFLQEGANQIPLVRVDVLSIKARAYRDAPSSIQQRVSNELREMGSSTIQIRQELPVEQWDGFESSISAIKATFARAPVEVPRMRNILLCKHLDLPFLSCGAVRRTYRQQSGLNGFIADAAGQGALGSLSKLWRDVDVTIRTAPMEILLFKGLWMQLEGGFRTLQTRLSPLSEFDSEDLPRIRAIQAHLKSKRKLSVVRQNNIRQFEKLTGVQNPDQNVHVTFGCNGFDLMIATQITESKRTVGPKLYLQQHVAMPVGIHEASWCGSLKRFNLGLHGMQSECTEILNENRGLVGDLDDFDGQALPIGMSPTQLLKYPPSMGMINKAVGRQSAFKFPICGDLESSPVCSKLPGCGPCATNNVPSDALSSGLKALPAMSNDISTTGEPDEPVLNLAEEEERENRFFQVSFRLVHAAEVGIIPQTLQQTPAPSPAVTDQTCHAGLVSGKSYKC